MSPSEHIPDALPDVPVRRRKQSVWVRITLLSMAVTGLAGALLAVYFGLTTSDPTPTSIAYQPPTWPIEPPPRPLDPWPPLVEDNPAPVEVKPPENKPVANEPAPPAPSVEIKPAPTPPVEIKPPPPAPPPVEVKPEPAKPDRARELVAQAVRAYGGEEKLKKLQMRRQKMTGKMNNEGMEMTLTCDTLLDRSGKFRNSFQFRYMDMDLTVLQIFDGERGWVSIAGMTNEMKPEEVKNLKDGFVSNQVQLLHSLLTDPKYRLTYEGNGDVQGKPAEKVRVEADGESPTTLYFDKVSGYLAKAEGTSLEVFQGGNADGIYFSNVKDFDGLKMPAKMAVLKDGKALIELEITEMSFPTTIDPKQFMAP
jgi:hypothetical protein